MARNLLQTALRTIVWVGTSKADLSALPDEVKASLGMRLFELQQGGTPLDMKPIVQLGRGLYELRERFDTNAYRVVYVVNLRDTIYVLHAFIKKSKSGIGIPRSDLALIRARLKRAQEQQRPTDMDDIPYDKSSGNVFADIGFSAAQAEEMMAKGALVLSIKTVMDERALTQKAAAQLCGTDQPTLSKVLHGRMESVTIDRLAAWSTKLGLDVEITVKRAGGTGNGHLVVTGTALATAIKAGDRLCLKEEVSC